MELMEVLNNRRAVRDFNDTPIERATIEKLIQSAILAPSAMNLQPWAFAVRLGREEIDRLGERVKDHLLKNFPQAGPEASLRKMVEDPNYVLFHHAPALVLVVAKSADSQAREDCCLAAQNLMLAARDEGIGTCWIGLSRPWLNLAATKKEFGIPPEYEFVAPIILGYPKSWPKTHGRNAAEIFWAK
ncbi:MAG: nitroreductase [Acidobacteriia bacterium]|nr:nitroreductase [Terriglobia bacterium]